MTFYTLLIYFFFIDILFLLTSVGSWHFKLFWKLFIFKIFFFWFFGNLFFLILKIFWKLSFKMLRFSYASLPNFWACLIPTNFGFFFKFQFFGVRQVPHHYRPPCYIVQNVSPLFLLLWQHLIDPACRLSCHVLWNVLLR